jgi:two-component system, chemotaxis family, protein-glutamate methylesterase/glutaminase
MPFFIIVIGASAGGHDALCKLTATLPPDLNAAVFIVIHLSRESIDNFLTIRLQKCTSLPCELAADNLSIKKGHVYIAPVDHHLVLRHGTMHLTKGPPENRWRPSIDVLFRSAAVHYSEQAIGIILTGMLDDGTAGMQAIQRCGGTCIVQEPAEAEYPDMPQSVINNTMVDFILPAGQMNEALQHTILTKTISGVKVPKDLKAEAALVDRTSITIGEMTLLGNQSVYSCPDCGGGLWEIKEGEHIRYRCHIGHAFSENELLSKQYESVNASLWVALRMMEERRNLLNKISKEEITKNLHILAKSHIERAKELEVHINNLKELLFNVKPN